MRIAVRLILLAAVVALGWWFWGVCFPSAEKVVLKKMTGLADTLTFSADANNITRAGKASSFISYFTVDAEIVVDVPELGSHTLSGRDEIRETGNGGFAAMPGLKVTFLDTTVKVGPDKQSADVSCTVRVVVGSSKDFGVEEMHFKFKKVEGDWRISRVETVKTLK
jgi:hypothetical protein